MTDLVIFSVGSVFFIATAWATIAFGLARFRELQEEDLAGSDLQVRSEGKYTEVWMTGSGDEQVPLAGRSAPDR